MTKTVKERKISALKWILVTVIISGLFILITNKVLPAVFGVSIGGLLTTVRNKLSTVGGVVGGALGYFGETLANFTNYVIAPLMNINPWAIVGFAGVMSLISVLVLNIYTYREVWR